MKIILWFSISSLSKIVAVYYKMKLHIIKLDLTDISLYTFKFFSLGTANASCMYFFLLLPYCIHNIYYYTSDALWKIWLVESIQSIHNSLWTWHDKCNICCRYCIHHVKFNVCLVTKPLGVFTSETKWPNASLLRMNYVKNV